MNHRDLVLSHKRTTPKSFKYMRSRVVKFLKTECRMVGPGAWGAGTVEVLYNVYRV